MKWIKTSEQLPTALSDYDFEDFFYILLDNGSVIKNVYFDEKEAKPGPTATFWEHNLYDLCCPIYYHAVAWSKPKEKE